jgi:hypothetical protein
MSELTDNSPPTDKRSEIWRRIKIAVRMTFKVDDLPTQEREQFLANLEENRDMFEAAYML